MQKFFPPMAAITRRLSIFLLLAVNAAAQPYIGVNYGEVADNLPPPDATARLLSTTTISKLRLYGTDPAMIRALAGTNISLLIGAANGDIPSLAADPSAAAAWVATNVLPYLPATAISAVSVGNEVLNLGDPNLASQLLPAMQNLRAALSGAGAASAAVKVSTVHTMAVLSQSDPPSSGAFHADLAGNLNGILSFLHDTGSPFMVNPYPYFAYRSDPRPETLDYCVFRPNAGRVDGGSGIAYANMFDAQVDAVRAALGGAGYGGVEIVVAETGWPYRGDPDEVGATPENAAAFVGGLVSHLRSAAGTPMMPGRSVDTYVFAMYDEDLKPGPTSERSFGIFRTDLTPTYDAGLVVRRSSGGGGAQVIPVASPTATTATPVVSPTRKPDGKAGGCSRIQFGDGSCYVPNGVGSDLTPLLLTVYLALTLLLVT